MNKFTLTVFISTLSVASLCQAEQPPSAPLPPASSQTSDAATPKPQTSQPTSTQESPKDKETEKQRSISDICKEQTC